MRDLDESMNPEFTPVVVTHAETIVFGITIILGVFITLAIIEIVSDFLD